MKKLLLVLAFFVSIGITAQEKTEFKILDETTLLKTVTFENGIVHTGTMSKLDNKWILDGVWRQLDENGRETLRVSYNKGRKRWIFKDLGEEIVYLTISEREGN